MQEVTMNEPRTVKTGGGQAGDDPTIHNTGALLGRGAGGSNWEETQCVTPDRPTGRSGPPPAWPPGPSAQPAARNEPAGGSQTMLMGGPTAEPSYAWLVIVEAAGHNPLLGRPLSLKSSGTTTLGRVPGNDIIISDPACSSQHARVRQEAGEEGKQVFVIYDLASANGLYVGAKTDYKDDKSRVYRRVLNDGDYILIGETTLVFKQV
jgi:hypothetical protein